MYNRSFTFSVVQKFSFIGGMCVVFLLSGCQSSEAPVPEVSEPVVKEDENIRSYLFRDFNDFYASIYFKDGSQPDASIQESFYYEIDDAVDKTGIKEFRPREFYLQNQQNPEILRALIYRLNRAILIQDLPE